MNQPNMKVGSPISKLLVGSPISTLVGLTKKHPI